MAWHAEAKTEVDAAWIPTICHQLRVLGGRWGTLLEPDLISSWEVRFQTATPFAAERLCTVLAHTGLKFPGGLPLALDVWHSDPTEERGDPVEVEERDINDLESPNCSLVVA
eukprot:13795294-Alexandrium_andersonii.AAC.1